MNDENQPLKTVGRIILYLLGGWLGLWTHNTTKQIQQISKTQTQHTQQLAGVVGLPTQSTTDNRSSSELINQLKILIQQNKTKEKP